mmetsp:Transcript_13545/g.31422  ORF Transcript_13545/g.31422 Transcript_13545/m.31422 type:complete len:283 (-) Transcript_13545:362-1210(-)
MWRRVSRSLETSSSFALSIWCMCVFASWESSKHLARSSPCRDSSFFVLTESSITSASTCLDSSAISACIRWFSSSPSGASSSYPRSLLFFSSSSASRLSSSILISAKSLLLSPSSRAGSPGAYIPPRPGELPRPPMGSSNCAVCLWWPVPGRFISASLSRSSLSLSAICCSARCCASCSAWALRLSSASLGSCLRYPMPSNSALCCEGDPDLCLGLSLRGELNDRSTTLPSANSLSTTCPRSEVMPAGGRWCAGMGSSPSPSRDAFMFSKSSTLISRNVFLS